MILAIVDVNHSYLSMPRTALKTDNLSAVVPSLFLYWYVMSSASLSPYSSRIPGDFVKIKRPTLKYIFTYITIETSSESHRKKQHKRLNVFQTNWYSFSFDFLNPHGAVGSLTKWHTSAFTSAKIKGVSKPTPTSPLRIASNGEGPHR